MAPESCVVGLVLDEKQFLSLPQKDRDCLLYRNQLATFDKLEEIQALLEGTKFQQKLQYYWLAGLSALSLWLLKVATNISFLFLPLIIFTAITLN